MPLDEGALVLLLPPNLLLWEEEVDDFNTCIQISPSTPHGPGRPLAAQYPTTPGTQIQFNAW